LKKENKGLKEKVSYYEGLEIKERNHESISKDAKDKFEKMYEEIQEKLENKERVIEAS
jgi:hypothetical protein